MNLLYMRSSSAHFSQLSDVLQEPAAELLEPRRDDEDDDTHASEETTMDLRLQLIRCRRGHALYALSRRALHYSDSARCRPRVSCLLTYDVAHQVSHEQQSQRSYGTLQAALASTGRGDSCRAGTDPSGSPHCSSGSAAAGDIAAAGDSEWRSQRGRSCGSAARRHPAVSSHGRAAVAGDAGSSRCNFCFGICQYNPVSACLLSEMIFQTLL